MRRRDSNNSSRGENRQGGNKGRTSSQVGRKGDFKKSGKFRPEKGQRFEKEGDEKDHKRQGQRFVKKRYEADAKGPKRYDKKKAEPQEKSGDELIRLNRFIANAGICSRREADEYIKTGVVKVNGKVITEMGHKVKPGDKVKFNDELIKSERKVYLLLNKPKDYVTTVDDPHATRTVMDLVRNACPERIYPVGRLDRNTTGVLLFTNDGDLAKRLMHPKYKKKKIYHAFLQRAVTAADLKQIADGIELEDGFIKPDAVEYVDENDKSQIGIELHSGRNRIVRRIFEHLGYKVTKLDRVYFAGLTKKNVPRGRYRFLQEKEINLLKMNAFK